VTETKDIANFVVDYPGNKYEPGLVERITEHVHQMTPQVLRRHYVEYERMIELADQNVMMLTESDRVEIAGAMKLIEDRLDEIIPKMAADIADHDRLSGYKTSLNWPDELPTHTKHIHFHFVELLEAWNLNPFKRDMTVSTVDEYAETHGETRFAFCSKESREDFLEFYGLDDFVVRRDDPVDEVDVYPNANVSKFWLLTLTNKFGKPEVESFLTTYRSAMNTLVAIHDERERAIRNDGGKIGFLCVDHFAARETHELMRIRHAREMLGAPNERR
jgi:hypothetical protein